MVLSTTLLHDKATGIVATGDIEVQGLGQQVAVVGWGHRLIPWMRPVEMDLGCEPKLVGSNFVFAALHDTSAEKAPPDELLGSASVGFGG